jgi:GNAT superfamily N-acetyltransferase
MKKLIKKILEEGVPHMHQPTGNSCGPTCLKMVHDFFVGDRFKISDICRACGTDWVVGTPPERMIKGLDYMGIQYIEHINDENPFDALREAIDKGHPCIIRTITQGTPHWIIATDYDNDVFAINDPWLGRIIYDEEELDSIWHMRNYFFYEVTGGDKDIHPDYDLEPDEDYMSEEPEMWSHEWIERFLRNVREAVGNETITMSDLADFDEDSGHQDWNDEEELLRAFIDWYRGGEEFMYNDDEEEEDEDEEEGDEEEEESREGEQLEIEFPEDSPNSSDEVEISHFESEDDIVAALRVGLKVFEGQMPPKNLIEYLSKAADWDVSVKATYQGKVVGFYLLAENQIYDYILHYMIRDYNCYSPEECNEKNPGSIKVDPFMFKDLSGVEGVALGVSPQHKGLGIGKKLMEYSQSLPYDYIWGQQYEHLGNIEHWKKRREIAAYFPGLYLTYQML